MERARLDPSPGRRRAVTLARAGRRARVAEQPEVDQPLPAFNSALLQAHRHHQQQLEQALQAVDEAAQALREAPGERTLFEYRQAVRRFLELVLPGSYRVERTTHMDLRGVRRLQVLVRCVNEELDRLAAQVLARQQDVLTIAARLMEIRGLLLDLVR